MSISDSERELRSRKTVGDLLAARQRILRRRRVLDRIRAAAGDLAILAAVCVLAGALGILLGVYFG